MVPEATRRLRILVADGSADRHRQVTETLAALGHESSARERSVETVGHATATHLPDVALVIVGEHSEQAFELIRTIVHEAACPVIAILDVQDRAFIDKAARLGIFSYIAHAISRTCRARWTCRSNGSPSTTRWKEPSGGGP